VSIKLSSLLISLQICDRHWSVSVLTSASRFLDAADASLAFHRAVHINSMTIHDEPVLPHGGYKTSGFGRFGGSVGFDEFLQTKTITWLD
jgi:acyl-CoA reductase-like NAD-dependent aldehyde dehydrogenase